MNSIKEAIFFKKKTNAVSLCASHITLRVRKVENSHFHIKNDRNRCVIPFCRSDKRTQRCITSDFIHFDLPSFSSWLQNGDLTKLCENIMLVHNGSNELIFLF